MKVHYSSQLGTEVVIAPLLNDYDPDGDDIILDTLFNVVGASVIWIQGDFVKCYFAADNGYGWFNYGITDGEFHDYAMVDVLIDCYCIVQCLSGMSRIQEPGVSQQLQDTVDLDLIRRFRDEVMKPSYYGARYIEMYYETTPEILFLIAILQPELASQAATMVELLQPSIRNLLDGDGQQPITAEQINAIQAFLTNLSSAGNANIQQIVTEELQRLGPLENYIGMPVNEVIFQTMVTDVEDEQHSVPTHFGLEQNYPNPFNPSTIIRYQVSSISQVSLKVYDLLGREIATLANEQKPAGIYEVTIDASGLSSGVSARGGYASGIYFYRLQAGSFVQTKKMILLR